MEATTQEFTLPLSGLKVVMRDWITGADSEYIQAAIHGGMKVKPDVIKGGATTGDFDLGAIFNQLHPSIEKYVVSIDGKTENIVEQALQLPEEDYDFLTGVINDKTSKKKTLKNPSQDSQ